PPRADTSKKVTLSDILGLDALSLLKDRNFLIFFLASVLICIPLAFYYQHAGQFLGEIGVANPAGKMTIGQISEILFMLLLPYFFKRFGFKMTMLVAMLAWGVRYLLFAYGDTGDLVVLLLLGIALHGVCYDFFFVSGQIYTDSKAGKAYKSSAQGLITLATYGIGMLIGFWAAGKITDAYLLSDGVHDWQTIWLYPAAFAGFVLVLFGLLFKNVKINYKT
ncbi:MAG TPA: MFS transporter, partial [Pricia sp.]|nr:MFS transporter [Pricia sp.]